MMTKQQAHLVFVSLLSTLLLSASLPAQRYAQTRQIRLSSGDLTFVAEAASFRYGFSLARRAAVQPDPTAGLILNNSPVSVRPAAACAPSRCVLLGTNTTGAKVRITVTLDPNHAELIAEPAHAGDQVRFVTAGAAPGYGLADHAVEQKLFSTLENKQYNTDVTGFADDSFLSGQGITRLVSNFVIYPKQGFAEVLIDPFMKIVHTSGAQIVQGVVHSGAQVKLHYFFGTPHQIYAAYRIARNDAGYSVVMPKYPAFGVGWEAFGALGWDTNEKTVQESVDRYLAQGYPLRWIVIGSGFWPSPPAMHETTSFGLWDQQKYPDPRALMRHFHQEGLHPLLGLRITFITTGPFSAEGVRKGYFLSKQGHPQVFTGSWPKLPYFLLDAHNPAALDWYMALVKRWQLYGIDGFKEDFYGYGGDGLRDDKVDPVNDRLMQEKQMVIERNGYLSSNGDLHRINDFNYDQDQDRGPVNALALAYSGFPLVYPDIVGGTFGEDRFSTQRTARMDIYMMRNAQWAALHSSMGMGEPPWTFSAPVQRVMLQAAKLHARIAPYIFSNAQRFARDGYPWTMTPLPVAFPDDPNVYGRGNAAVRGYEWLIGDAMLATPLYGNDYAHAGTRDIYLPRGRWMDFDTGTMYDGGRFLRAFPLPPGKTPLFIGGSGVTLEAVNGAIAICVYPVTESSAASVTLPQSDLPVAVHVHGLPAGVKWKTVRVTDATGHELPAQATGFAFSFLPRPGETYTVQAIR